MRRLTAVLPVSFVGLIVCSLAPAADYDPLYWAEGGISRRALRDGNPAVLKEMVDDVYAKGWRGITYWGASHNGAKMTHHFRSPFLEKQGWAELGNDSLTPLVEAAHAKGMKVMVNIEGSQPVALEGEPVDS